MDDSEIMPSSYAYAMNMKKIETQHLSPMNLNLKILQKSCFDCKYNACVF